MPSELLFSRAGAQAWAAVVEAGRTVELRHVDHARPGRVGDIFLGRVRRVVAGLDAAFVDLGLERDALLPLREISSGQEGPRSGSKPRALERQLAQDQEVLVQITREGEGAKGPQLTGRIALTGRLLVQFPLGGGRSVSKRIVADGERRRLAAILEGLEPERAGFIVRSAAVAAGADALRAEAAGLAADWAPIRAACESGGAARRLRAADDLLVRSLHDAPPEGFALIVVDQAADQERVLRLAGSRVQLHDGPGSLLSARGIDREIAGALRPEVRLACGGFIVVEPTAALIAIDVNSAKFVSGKDAAETARVTNIEAAVEIARLLRLRDLGGLIVVDFIDVECAEDRSAVTAALADALRADRAKIRVSGWTRSGLFELTRARTGPALSRSAALPPGDSAGKAT